MDVIDLPLGQIIPYAGNPRRNEKAIATVAASIAEFGWRQPIVVDELNALLNGLNDDGAVAQDGEDEVPETPEDPISCPGDLWVLGDHRLLCGDATVATDVERVLGPVKPLLMVSDPPYGVEYDPGWRNASGAAKTKRTGKVLNDDRADWREAWALFPGDVAYVWHGALHAAAQLNAAVRAA